MNRIVATKNVGATPALATLTTEHLRAELARSLDVTAAHLTHLAAVWRELESRGEDLSGLRSGLWAYMPLIASGKLRAEIVVQYAGHSLLLRRLAELPHEDQDRLLVDSTVPLVDYRDGDWVERRVPIAHLRAAEIGQVFADGVRSPQEQRRLALARAQRQPRTPPAAPRPGDAVVRAAQQEMATRPRGRGLGLSVLIPLSPEERTRLETAARLGGVPVARLIRAALATAGLLEESPQ